MKNKLISLLHELITENEEKDFKYLKISIMQNSAFLANPKGFSDLSSITTVVNSYIESQSVTNKANVEKVITNLNAKF